MPARIRARTVALVAALALGSARADAPTSSAPPDPSPPAVPDPSLPPPPARLPRSPPPRSGGAEARSTSLVLNTAALAGNPFAEGWGWRIEAGVEQRLRVAPRISSAVLVGAGHVAVPGYDAAVVVDVAGQFRWYALGGFQRGVYVGGQAGFWRIGERYAWAPGALAGLKLVTPGGATLDLQLCAEWPIDTFATDRGPRVVPIRDAWRALAPGLLMGVGFSPREGRARAARR